MEPIRSAYRWLVPGSVRQWIWAHVTREIMRLRRRDQRRRDPPPVEPHLQAVLASLLSPGDFFVDVGACVGGLAIVAGRLVGPEGGLLCFEPAAWNYRKLVRNLASASGIPGKSETHNAAVGDRCGTVRLYQTFVDECHTTIHGVNNDHGYVREVAVPLLTLDFAFETVGRSPTLIKIDVEGAEPAVLRGALGLLAAERPLLIVEIGNPQNDQLAENPRIVWELLSSLGYRGWVIETDYIGPWHPTQCNCRQDILFFPQERQVSTLDRLREKNLLASEVIPAWPGAVRGSSGSSEEEN